MALEAVRQKMVECLQKGFPLFLDPAATPDWKPQPWAGGPPNGAAFPKGAELLKGAGPPNGAAAGLLGLGAPGTTEGAPKGPMDVG